MEVSKVLKAAKILGLVPVVTDVEEKKMTVFGDNGKMFIINFSTLMSLMTAALSGGLTN